MSARTSDFNNMSYMHRMTHEHVAQARSLTQPGRAAGQTASFFQQSHKLTAHCPICPNVPSLPCPAMLGLALIPSLSRRDARQRTLSPQALSRSRLRCSPLLCMGCCCLVCVPFLCRSLLASLVCLSVFSFGTGGISSSRAAPYRSPSVCPACPSAFAGDICDVRCAALVLVEVLCRIRSGRLSVAVRLLLLSVAPAGVLSNHTIHHTPHPPH
jgi:hypothetical protein